MAKRDIVVMAASAGGIEALRAVAAGLPTGFPGAILVVVHVPAGGGRALAGILERAGPLPAAHAVDGEPLEQGRIYIAPPEHHLLLCNGRVLVRRGPKENGHRPAADPLFRSAAAHYGPRVCAVILSGTLNDGTAGLLVVRRKSGVAVVQDPGDALFEGMPASAIEVVGADHVLPARAIGPLLADLVCQDVNDHVRSVSEELRTEVDVHECYEGALQAAHLGVPSEWPCPDCSGVLWQVDDEPVFRFRCRVGHAWTAESLLEQQGDEVDTALWMALRTLEDRASLSQMLADRAAAAGRRSSAARFRIGLDEMNRSIEVLRRLLTRGGGGTGDMG